MAQRVAVVCAFVAVVVMSVCAVYTQAEVVEMLKFTIPCDRVDQFIEADHKVWTTYLESTAPFRNKQVWVDPAQDGAVTCNLWSVIHWESRDAWKALPPAVLAKVQADFVAAYGGDPVPMEMPTGNGFDIANSTGNWSRN